jgi:hypothetical protein
MDAEADGAIIATKHSAPGPYLGFALQPVRLCVHLLTCEKGALVSLEFLDDVAIHGTDGSLRLEQTKSALAQNPLSDWAPDLWKAISNWLESTEPGNLDPVHTFFSLYVTPVRSGNRAQALANVKTLGDVASIVSAISAELHDMEKPPACMPFLQRFLDASDDRRLTLLRHLEIVSADNDPIEPLRELMRATVAPNIIDLMCKSAIGFAKEEADRLIRARKTAIIDADAFKSQFRAFVQRNNLPGLLSFTAPPEEAVVTSVLSQRRMFVRQLEIIEVTEDERFRAVSDYLRTSADKTVWAEAGLVFEQNLRDWDNDLIRRHGSICGEIADVHPEKEGRVRGRIVYRRCCGMDARIDDRVVPGHFILGCFHALADSFVLGWHPDYETLLRDDV